MKDIEFDAELKMNLLQEEHNALAKQLGRHKGRLLPWEERQEIKKCMLLIKDKLRCLEKMG